MLNYFDLKLILFDEMRIKLDTFLDQYLEVMWKILSLLPLAICCKTEMIPASYLMEK